MPTYTTYTQTWHPGHRVWLHKWTRLSDGMVYEIAMKDRNITNADYAAALAALEENMGQHQHEGFEREKPREFQVKDSGERMKFDSGMVRDTAAGKVDWWRVFVGPILERLAVHVTKGAEKYPDIKPGIPNWTLASGEAEFQRFRDSAARHFAQWMRGDRDEDHAAAVVFNLNGAEYVRGRMKPPVDYVAMEKRLLAQGGIGVERAG